MDYDILFANKIKSKHPEHGDIVVFKTKFKNNMGINKNFIKRLVLKAIKLSLQMAMYMSMMSC